jgi:hypothetical protein
MLVDDLMLMFNKSKLLEVNFKFYTGKRKKEIKKVGSGWVFCCFQIFHFPSYLNDELASPLPDYQGSSSALCSVKSNQSKYPTLQSGVSIVSLIS